MLLDIVFVIAGLALLVAGGEALVRGASTLAAKVGLSPLVIGLVVVSAATSAPELAVTVDAVLRGEPDLALGNVVGSNIVNILLILGVSAVFLPLLIKRQIVRFDLPVMVGISILLIVVSLDGQIGRLDGVLLLAGLVAHTVVSIVVGRREVRAENEEPDLPAPGAAPVPLWLAAILLLGGIGLLVLGAQLLVNGAVSIATGLGVSSLVIGLTVVAVGTSLASFWCSAVRSVDSPDDAMTAIADPEFDARQVAVAEEEIGGMGASGRGPRYAGTARLTHYSPERATVETSADQTSLLVMTDTYFPGWQATVDGRKSAIHRTDYLLRGVVVPAGRHRVAFAYRPASWDAGRALSLAALVALAVLAFSTRWRVRTPEDAREPVGSP